MGSFSKTRDIRVGVKGFLFFWAEVLFSLYSFALYRRRRREKGVEEERKKTRCGGGSTSRNKQEATPLSGPPAAADCHVASEDKQGSRSVVSPSSSTTTQTLFLHDNELLNGASGGGGTVNFEPCVRPVPPLTARHRRVSQGKQAPASLRFPPGWLNARPRWQIWPFCRGVAFRNLSAVRFDRGVRKPCQRDRVRHFGPAVQVISYVQVCLSEFFFFHYYYYTLLSFLISCCFFDQRPPRGAGTLACFVCLFVCVGVLCCFFSYTHVKRFKSTLVLC